MLHNICSLYSFDSMNQPAGEMLVYGEDIWRHGLAYPLWAITVSVAAFPGPSYIVAKYPHCLHIE